jgi:hypothetical protein
VGSIPSADLFQPILSLMEYVHNINHYVGNMDVCEKLEKAKQLLEIVFIGYNYVHTIPVF